MHSTQEQHTVTAPAATFDGSFIEADSTLKAPAPKHSMQLEMQGNLQTQSKHLLSTNNTHSMQTADPLLPPPPSIQECGALVFIFQVSLQRTSYRNYNLHVIPFQVFINRLKVIRFSVDLMSSSKLFHNLAPSYLRLMRPYVV